MKTPFKPLDLIGSITEKDLTPEQKSDWFWYKDNFLASKMQLDDFIYGHATPLTVYELNNVWTSFLSEHIYPYLRSINQPRR